MICLFNSTDTDFSSNGEMILHPLKCILKKEDNGDYILNIEDKLTETSIYEEGKIVVVTTPWGRQAFRLTNPDKKNDRITIKAWHIYYDSSRYVIKDAYVFDKGCNDAIDHLNNSCDTKTPFKTFSDINGINSYRCIRKSFEEALNVVLERWGGHLLRDNWNISIMQSIGQDNGVVISAGKNISTAQKKEDWSKVVTKLMPVGKDGLLLDEVWLESNVKYDIPYTKVVHFEQDIEEEDFEDQESYQNALIDNLRQQAIEYLQTNCVPQINYKINANIKNITDVGDIIHVKHPKCQIDIITSVISIQYDCIAQKYTSVEFGNFKKKLTNLFTDVKNEINTSIQQNNDVQNAKLSTELKDATNTIWAALKEGYVIYDDDKILIVDMLPKEQAKNVIMINNGGIGFSKNGINGTFNSAWTIDGTFDASQVNVINLMADMIKGGTLKLGSNLNESGVLELYDDSNNLIAEVNKDGITMHCTDGSFVKINPDVGFAGFDKNGNKKYWADGDEFHMEDAVVEQTLAIANYLKAVPIENETNIGIGIVSLL